MKPVQMFSLICLTIIQHLLINIGKGEIVSVRDSGYNFNITWTPVRLVNGKNYTLNISTDGEKLTIDKFNFCIQIQIDTLNQIFFDDCIDTTCNTLKENITPLFPNIDEQSCPFTLRRIQRSFNTFIDEWVPLIAGNFNFTFNVTLGNPNKTIIKGIGNIFMD